VPKGVIVLLVVVAVVFVVLLAMGAGQGETADERNPPGIVDALGDLGGGRQLKVGEDGVTTTCDSGSNPEAVVVDSSCQINVPSRGRFARPVQAGLTPQSGDSIRVVFAPNEGDPPDPHDAPGDARCLALAVDRHGGAIGITCVGGGQCPVSLRAKGCEP
jgi:hypothetical protein